MHEFVDEGLGVIACWEWKASIHPIYCALDMAFVGTGEDLGRDFE